jgi:hypothetical protein
MEELVVYSAGKITSNEGSISTSVLVKTVPLAQCARVKVIPPSSSLGDWCCVGCIGSRKHSVSGLWSRTSEVGDPVQAYRWCLGPLERLRLERNSQPPLQLLEHVLEIYSVVHHNNRSPYPSTGSARE